MTILYFKTEKDFRKAVKKLKLNVRSWWHTRKDTIGVEVIKKRRKRLKKVI